MCDVAREAGDELLGALRELGLDETGSIAVENIDLSLSKRADQAEDEAPGEGADAVLWEHLTDATHEESTLSVTYLAFLTLATMIAACGVVLDNAILIVGAMAVGPEFGPLAGICTALVQRAPAPGAALAARAARRLRGGDGGDGGLQPLHGRGRPLHARPSWRPTAPTPTSSTRPDWFSFVVAVLAGVAGTLSLTSAKSGALVGVAISVTTVPAAANAAVALSYGEYGQTWGSTEQLLLNLLGIVLAGTLTLLAQKWLWASSGTTAAEPVTGDAPDAGLRRRRTHAAWARPADRRPAARRRET